MSYWDCLTNINVHACEEMHVIEEVNTVTAMDKNTSRRGQRSPHVTFKMGPDLKSIVLVYRMIVQKAMLLPQNAQFIYKSDLPCCTIPVTGNSLQSLG